MKTNKSFSKRLRVTKTGKILSRKPGFNHFNAKKSRVNELKSRKPVQVIMNNKNKARFLA